MRAWVWVSGVGGGGERGGGGVAVRKSFRKIGHFRNAASLCFKTRPSAKPSLCKLFFIIMQIKLIFTRKVLHFASF